ncbi:MAG: hypothetical protein M3O09_06050 [Acidobacteriota bacterium]|nr:hypothetical protein [Acidobacteriota bacterium]
MAINYTAEWREIFDVALYQPNKLELRQQIELAREAINKRIHNLMKDGRENGGSVPERIELRDALITLDDLYKLAYTRKPSGSVSGARNRAAISQLGES